MNMPDISSQMLNKLIDLASSNNKSLSIAQDTETPMLNSYDPYYKITIGSHSYMLNYFNENALIEAYANLTGKLQQEAVLRNHGIGI